MLEMITDTLEIFTLSEEDVSCRDFINELSEKYERYSHTYIDIRIKPLTFLDTDMVEMEITGKRLETEEEKSLRLKGY